MRQQIKPVSLFLFSYKFFNGMHRLVTKGACTVAAGYHHVLVARGASYQHTVRRNRLKLGFQLWLLWTIIALLDFGSNHSTIGAHSNGCRVVFATVRSVAICLGDSIFFFLFLHISLLFWFNCEHFLG